MNRKQRIKKILINYFNEFTIDVIDNSKDHIGHNNFDGSQESHFQIFIKPKINIKINRIEIHRKINEILTKEFSIGLHSLEIRIIN